MATSEPSTASSTSSKPSSTDSQKKGTNIMSSIPRTQEELDRAIASARGGYTISDFTGLLGGIVVLGLVPITLSAAVSYWIWAWNLVP